MKAIKTLVTVLLISFCTQVFAQVGAIKGAVKDATTKEPIIAANVVIKGTTNGSSTDFEGNYIIKNVQPGTYTIQVSYISYKPFEGTVVVRAGETAVLNINLNPDVASLSGVDVVAERITNSETAVLAEMRQSSQIISGISSQQIKKSQDGNAAQVVSRVPGITIVENSFVMIRGLNQRYNSVMINNVFAPSTEPDSRAFSFDLIPSNILDRMIVLKSGSADNPGDFAGGVIKIYTKNTTDFDNTDISVGLGYRTATSFGAYQRNIIGGEFTGFDGGRRALPSGFPGTSDYQSLPSVRTSEFAQLFTNNFKLNDGTTLPDLKVNFNFSKNFKVKNIKVSNVNGIGYSNTNQNFEVERFRWSQRGTDGISPIQFKFTDTQYENEVRLNAISNFQFIVNPRNRYSFKNTFNQIGESNTIIRNGNRPQERETDDLRDYAFQYLARSIFTSQFEGNHGSTNGKNNFDWVVGYNYVNRNEPDFRRFRTFKPQGTDEPYTLIDPPGPTTFDNARFFSNLQERAYTGGANYTYKFSNNADSASIKISTGVLNEFKQRDFQARWLSYVYRLANGTGEEKTEILQQPIDQVFSNENLATSTRDGWILAEGTNASDRYDASSFLSSAYLTAAIPVFKAFDINAGVRVEYFNQQLNSQTQTGVPININNTTVSPLPFLNVAYAATQRSNVRLAYSRTVNRPEFRELAPFLYYNFEFDANFVGEPNLRVADINNIDLRYEFYPNQGETVTFGGFFKDFSNPIETIVETAGLGQQFRLANVNGARNFGAELELRKELKNMPSPFLRKVTLLANASYIYSRVDLGNAPTLAQDSIRPLAGQSPYVVNFAMYYTDQSRNFAFSILYNVFGPRIFLVGNDQWPTVYELPRHLVDITVTKKLSNRMELKAGISDLLNYKTQMYQDSDRNDKIDKNIDDPIMIFRRGSVINASISYKLY